MSCEQYRVALQDAALGAACPPEVEAHLAVCPGCRPAFDERRHLLGRIDAEIVGTLAVAPSPDFVARVELRVAERSSLRPPRLMGWLVTAAAVAAALVVGVHFTGRTVVEPPSPPRPVAVEPPPSLLVPHVEPRPLPPGAASAPAVSRTIAPAVRAVPTARAVRPAEPEVLLPPGQDALVQHFARSMRDRRVDPSSLLAVGLDSGETPDIAAPAVEIKPLKIEPIKGSES